MKSFFFLVIHFLSRIEIVFSPVFLTWDPVGKKTVVSSLNFSVCELMQYFFPGEKIINVWNQVGEKMSGHFLHVWVSEKKNLRRIIFSTLLTHRKNLFFLSPEKKNYFLSLVSPEKNVLPGKWKKSFWGFFFGWFFLEIFKIKWKIFLVKRLFSMFETECGKTKFWQKKNTFNKAHFSNCVFL